MKIDEKSIDYNTLRLIREIAYESLENIGIGDNEDVLRVIYLSEIRGILNAADALKEVLNS